MALIVQKYGGKSLATPRLIKQAASRIKALKSRGDEVLVVVSAMGRMTDHLIRLAKRTALHPPQRELDMLMTAGERISMALLAMALDELTVPAISFTGSQSGIVTSNNHTDARIVTIKASRIKEELSRGRVVIVAGFQGVSEQREITTLGRGGSDTTAVAMAAILGAKCCEILTDVDGLYSADPKVVPSAFLIKYCRYDLALELASLGAKMHHRSLELAIRYQVPIRISSSTNSETCGTLLYFDPDNVKEKDMESLIIQGIATQDGYCYFETTAKLSMLLAEFKKARITLRFFNFSVDRTTFLCEEKLVTNTRKILANFDPHFLEVSSISIVSIVAEGLNASSEFVPDFIDVVENSGSKYFFLTTNSISATIAVPSTDKKIVAQALHEHWLTNTSKLHEKPNQNPILDRSQPTAAAIETT